MQAADDCAPSALAFGFGPVRTSLGLQGDAAITLTLIVLYVAAQIALAVWAGLCRLPDDLRWSHLVGAGFLGGIGFTMSIFIANLAFPADPALVNASKMAILAGSLVSALLGYAWLQAVCRQPAATNS